MATSIFKRTLQFINVLGNGWQADLNEATSMVSVANGWVSDKQNYPSDFGQTYGLLITAWPYVSRAFVTDTTVAIQMLIRSDGKIYARVKDNSTWGSWASKTT